MKNTLRHLVGAGNAADLIPEPERHVRGLVCRFQGYFELAGGRNV